MAKKSARKPAGYSGTPLIKKLGVKPGMRVRLVNEPEQYFDLLGETPDDIKVLKSTRGPIDFGHLFVVQEAELTRSLPPFVKHLAANGMLWISWPKKTSALAKRLQSDGVTVIDEGVVRATGLDTGLVDVKICAVDDDWSGLKFVRRLKDR